MTRLCWFIGHRYVEKVATGEYAPHPYTNPMTLIEVPVPYMRLQVFDHCVRCGKKNPEKVRA